MQVVHLAASEGLSPVKTLAPPQHFAAKWCGYRMWSLLAPNLLTQTRPSCQATSATMFQMVQMWFKCFKADEYLWKSIGNLLNNV